MKMAWSGWQMKKIYCYFLKQLHKIFVPKPLVGFMKSGHSSEMQNDLMYREGLKG